MKADKPWWLKQRRFVVPAILRQRIEKLPEDIQKYYCFIVSKIVVTTKKRPTLFQPVSRTYFKDFIGSNYRDYLNQLQRWHIIEVNEQYLNDPEHGFCKSYRLHPAARKARKVKVCFDKKAGRPLRDKSKLSDDVAEFVYCNLKRLTVRSELLAHANIVDEVEAGEWAARIHFEQFNVHYSPKARRLYHAAISMPKVARRNLVVKGDPALALYEYDVKSCMPVILLGIAYDPAEKARLKTLLDGDIYTTIANESAVTKERDDIKLDFMLFLNGSVLNYVQTFFHTHLPSLTETVMKSKGAEKGMAWFGQRVESEIMAQEVPRQLLDSGKHSKTLYSLPLTCGGNPEGILYIPMHDGWLGIERDEQQVAGTVRGEFFKRLGYWVTITKTKLVTGKETVLVADPP